MKIIKTILIIIVALIAVTAIIGMFLPSHVHLERTAVLQSQPTAIYSQVDDLKNWNNWMPWNKMDPKMKIIWGDKTEGQGASYSWESANTNVGTGKATITQAKPYEMVETNLDFGKNGSGTSTVKMDKQDQGTKVTWSFDCDMGANPFKKIMGAMMDKMMGNSFAQGLRDLDSAALASLPPTDAAMSAATEISAQDSIPSN